MRHRYHVQTPKTFDDKLKDVLKGLTYNLEYDYDRGSHSCTCGDDYCRCGTIINVRILSINLNGILHDILNFITREKKDLSRIDTYCIGRLYIGAGGASKDNYKVSVEGGYYGEEIGGGSFNNSDEFISELNTFLNTNMNDVEKIQYVLSKEYGYLINSVKNITSVKIITLTSEHIEVGNPDHYQKVGNEKYLITAYKDYQYPLCVVTPSNGLYKIIDGYHRFFANKDNGDSFDVVEIN